MFRDMKYDDYYSSPAVTFKLSSPSAASGQ
jgi:hypothetical protein